MDSTHGAPFATLLMLIVVGGGCGGGHAATDATHRMLDVKFTCCPGAFDPNDVTIDVGDTLRFVNVDNADHNVAIPLGGVADTDVARLAANMPGAEKNNALRTLDSPWVHPGQSYLLSFAGVAPGAFRGYCSIHANMRFTIHVRPRAEP